MQLIPADEVCRELDSRIEALAAELLPLGRRVGGVWMEAQRAKGGLGDSLMVYLSGPKKGKWDHFASGDHGDGLDLVAYLRFAGDKKEAFQWALDWTGMRQQPGGQKPRRQPPPAPDPAEREKAEAEERRRREKMRNAAMRRWTEAAAIAGTPAQAYLAGRGLDPARLQRMPRALRFHAGMRHKETGEALHPAMLGYVMTPGGRFLTVHRTYLEPFAGGWRKLTGVSAAKVAYSSFHGGFIPLWRGAGGARWTGMDAGASVILSEGIEDGLAAALAMPHRRVAVAVTLGNMAAIAWPRAVTELVLLCQHDTAAEALKGRDRAIAAGLKQGLSVRTAFPDPAWGKDMADAMGVEA